MWPNKVLLTYHHDSDTGPSHQCTFMMELLFHFICLFIFDQNNCTFHLALASSCNTNLVSLEL